ncbi:thioesterase II family protein [Saccharothrix hoggarensis]|uniref:Thioesterase II family protein n=1 Tax=Saccharothrix hoggarensis TaxID=913853 RepID=A0ABW3R3M3_9PSEU
MIGVNEDVLVRLAGPEEPELELVVFPGAGAGPSAVVAWRDLVPPTWRLSAVCLPGRGARFGEPVFEEPGRIADEEVAALAGVDRPVVFAGHSIGALWALETATRVPPALLVTAACQAPPPGGTVPTFEASEEDDREFIRDLLVALGVTDEDTLDELVDISVPVLRADIDLAARWAAPDVRLACPILSFYGTEDPTPSVPWSDYTATADVVTVPGDHYFFQDSAPAVVAELTARVAR